MTKDFSPASEDKPMLTAFPTAGDQPSFMGNFPWTLYPFTADRSQMFSTTFDPLQQQVYPGAGRWPTGAWEYTADTKAMEMSYPMTAFQGLQQPTMEPPYPVDPCPSTIPSTSVAGTVDYKPIDYSKSIDAGYMMNTRNHMNAVYNYPMFPYSDLAQTQALTANWKVAVKGTNGVKAGFPPPKHKTGPGTNNVRVRTQDTYRVVYTDQQRTELELEYQTQKFISADRKAELSGRLNLTERQVKIWFQNRRAKDRRENRNKP